MIFILNIEDPCQAIVYNNLIELNNFENISNIPVAFFEGKRVILDENGDIYKWNLTKEEENNIIGFSIEYSIKKNGKNIELAQKCIESYKISRIFSSTNSNNSRIISIVF